MASGPRAAAVGDNRERPLRFRIWDVCVPVINATCHWTVYGGSVMWPEVIEAMADARRSCVDMRQLLDRASEVIAHYTHAEAGYVVSGCAAAIS